MFLVYRTLFQINQRCIKCFKWLCWRKRNRSNIWTCLLWV